MKKVNASRPLDAVDLRDGIDVGECVAVAAETVRQRLGRLGQLFARIDITRVDLHEAHQLGFRQQQFAGELHLGYRVSRSLGDVNRNVDVLLVRRDRNLSRIDGEFQIAAIRVVAAQRFEVALQLLLRILIVLGVPGQPTRRRQLHFVDQRLFRKRARPDDVDVGDLRRFTFFDGEIDRDAITLLRRHRGRYLDRVIAVIDVLPLEFLLGAFQRRAIEDARFGDADVLQRLFERVLVEFLGAADVDLAYRRALLHDDHQHAVLGFQPHVAKKAGRIQRLDRGRGLFIVDTVADLDRKIAEHRSRFGALYALDADILDHERLERHRGVREQCGEQQSEQRRQRRQRLGSRAGVTFARRLTTSGGFRRVGTGH